VRQLGPDPPARARNSHGRDSFDRGSNDVTERSRPKPAPDPGVRLPIAFGDTDFRAASKPTASPEIAFHR
jgi:hypothetical protein